MKIVVPVMPRSLEEAQSLEANKYVMADIIEWRADYLTSDKIMTVAPAIFEKFSGKEIIFTLRTQTEGGKITLSDDEYVSILKNINHLYKPEYLDFEYFSHREIFSEMLECSNLVLSYHNFSEIPDNILEIFSDLTALAPKLVKVSVMPQSDREVLDLINYAKGFKVLNPKQEFAVIAMGKLGRITRIASDLLGSSWTFASLDATSAPGQINLADMVKIRDILDED